MELRWLPTMCAAITAVVFVASGCAASSDGLGTTGVTAPPDEALRSPNDALVAELVTEVGDEEPPSLRLEIRPSDGGSAMFTAEERWSARHRTFIVWQESTTLWLYSGDVGTSAWRYDASQDRWLEIDRPLDEPLLPASIDEAIP